MIVTLAGLKGGTGKSTVALHLAETLSEHGRVALLDLDRENQTCVEYAAGKHLPFTVATPDSWCEQAREPWDHLVIDSPPGQPRINYDTWSSAPTLPSSRPARTPLACACWPEPQARTRPRPGQPPKPS